MIVSALMQWFFLFCIGGCYSIIQVLHRRVLVHFSVLAVGSSGSVPSSSFQRCYIGFKSGDFEGQGNVSICCYFRYYKHSCHMSYCIVLLKYLSIFPFSSSPQSSSVGFFQYSSPYGLYV